RPPIAVGVVAKSIAKYGDEAQRRTWVPAIRSGEAMFSLGYSEPEAGSDLAGLNCRAENRGDHYAVTGSKCWNTGAHSTDYIWLLCRTGEPGSRGKGLSLLIVPRETPGLTVRALEVMGGHVFATLDFDNAKIPVENRIGPENGAWAMMGAAL